MPWLFVALTSFLSAVYGRRFVGVPIHPCASCLQRLSTPPSHVPRAEVPATRYTELHDRIIWHRFASLFRTRAWKQANLQWVDKRGDSSQDQVFKTLELEDQTHIGHPSLVFEIEQPQSSNVAKVEHASERYVAHAKMASTATRNRITRSVIDALSTQSVILVTSLLSLMLAFQCELRGSWRRAMTMITWERRWHGGSGQTRPRWPSHFKTWSALPTFEGSLLNVYHFSTQGSRRQGALVAPTGVKQICRIHQLVSLRSTAGDYDVKSIATGQSDPEVLAAKKEVLDAEFPENRWFILYLVSTGYIVWTMCKVNMSVAILPMTQQYAWDSPTVGLIQSALFWGYAASQVPGGFLATRFGGKRVLLAAALVWSLMTVAAPFAAASSTEFLLASRFLVGLGEGLAPPAGARIIATWVPETERSRAVAILGSGSKTGNVLALLVAPQIIGSFGWPSVFYAFGLLSLLWAAAWAIFGQDRDPCGVEACLVDQTEALEEEEDAVPIPWSSILTSAPVLGIFGSHFGNNWGMFGLLTWLPSYLNRELGFDLQGSSFLTILPSLFAILCAGLSGSLADRLRFDGMSLTDVRKLSQTIAFVVPASCLGLLASGIPLNSTVQIALLILAVGSSSFSYGGLYSSHIDLNAKYAGLVNGLSTTVGAVAGTLSNIYCGNTLASTSWNQALFIPSVVCYIIGLVMYVALYDATPLDWDADVDESRA